MQMPFPDFLCRRSPRDNIKGPKDGLSQRRRRAYPQNFMLHFLARQNVISGCNRWHSLGRYVPTSVLAPCYRADPAPSLVILWGSVYDRTLSCLPALKNRFGTLGVL
ncbi:hypothetical protein CEXT_810231 [Caerostris extrusa]|uniref:Uncharacterized protein n=1 Tax=Caerostris extrusa TaxID=172846 RepID=A0AAV4UDD8_CAEEX|nr:hypothetical protein CEXT_810231 [Caerostris extrusa]